MVNAYMDSLGISRFKNELKNLKGLNYFCKDDNI